MMPLKIAIADDQLLFRKGMALLIREFKGMELVAEAENGKDLLQQLDQRPGQIPDILLLDISMPEMDGIDTFREARKRFPGIRIIMLSIHADDVHILAMIRAGANGYLIKNSEPEEVEKAIRMVMEKDFYFNERTIMAMQKNLLRKKHGARPDPTDELTSREKEILELVCGEFTNADIATRLFISERTVEGHRNNLLLKTGARNTAGLVIYAIKNSIIFIDKH